MIAALLLTALLGPTVTITTNIQDTWLSGGAIDANWGGATDYVQYGGCTSACITCATADDANVALLRIPTAQIPLGTITAVRLNFWTDFGNSQVLSAFIVKDANNWVEGTANGITQVGSSDWTHTIHTTNTWAGAAGAKTSGTDYDADASPPTKTVTLNSYNAFTLRAAWATAWRDATRTNNGFIVRSCQSAAGGGFMSMGSAHPPYFEIDYSLPSVLFWNLP